MYINDFNKAGVFYENKSKTVIGLGPTCCCRRNCAGTLYARQQNQAVIFGETLRSWVCSQLQQQNEYVHHRGERRSRNHLSYAQRVHSLSSTRAQKATCLGDLQKRSLSAARGNRNTTMRRVRTDTFSSFHSPALAGVFVVFVYTSVYKHNS